MCKDGYNIYLSHRHPWIVRKIANFTFSTLASNKGFETSITKEQSKILKRLYSREELLEDMVEMSIYVKVMKHYIWAFLQSRDLDKLVTDSIGD